MTDTHAIVDRREFYALVNEVVEALGRQRPQVKAETDEWLRTVDELEAGWHFYEKVKLLWDEADPIHEWRRWNALNRAAREALDLQGPALARLKELREQIAAKGGFA